MKLHLVLALAWMSCLGATSSCARKGEPERLEEPVDLVVSASANGSASTTALADLLGKRTCRDGFLFDLAGAPADVGGFGTLMPIDDEPVTPRIALTGTMGTVSGDLQSDDVERVTCKMVGNLRSCFQFELRTKPTLRGQLGLEIDVALNGKVMETRRTGGIALSETLMGCISNAFVYAQYPMPKAKTTFTYALQVKAHAHLSARSVQLVDSGVTFAGAGKLPSEIVKRIVRATFPRFRACYELGVDLDPALKGHVTATFVIEATGAVDRVAQGPTTMPDKIVASCVIGAFRTLSFPQPEGGDVEVAMPLAFANVP